MLLSFPLKKDLLPFIRVQIMLLICGSFLVLHAEAKNPFASKISNPYPGIHQMMYTGFMKMNGQTLAFVQAGEEQYTLSLGSIFDEKELIEIYPEYLVFRQDEKKYKVFLTEDNGSEENTDGETSDSE